MYRSKRPTEHSDSSEDKENNESIQSVDKSVSANESITEIFKKLSLRDRHSEILINVQNPKINAFMTSSPLNQNYKLTKPIFAKKEPLSPLEKFEGTYTNDGDGAVQRACTMGFSQKPPIFHKRKSNEKIEPIDHKKEETVVSKTSIKRNPSFHRSNISLMSQKATVPKPFSFENKDKALMENRQKMLEDDIMEKKRLASAFRANPMPISSSVLPEKISLKLTKPLSFQFKSDERISQQRENSKLKDLSLSASNNASFGRSRDLSYMQKSPFRPKPSTVSLTCPETPEFSLTSRLERRREFDQHVHLQEQVILQAKKELEEASLAKERIELKKLRSENIIKANPIRTFKSVDVVFNSKTTLALTPKFSDRFKKN